MTTICWEEWDGKGFDRAYAWTAGDRWEERTAMMALRQLGIDVPAGKTTELVRGYVGSIEEDGEDDLFVCNASGVTWLDDEIFVDAESIRAVTFAVFVDRE